jgi:hypothetical protein
LKLCELSNRHWQGCQAVFIEVEVDKLLKVFETVWQRCQLRSFKGYVPFLLDTFHELFTRKIGNVIDICHDTQLKEVDHIEEKEVLGEQRRIDATLLWRYSWQHLMKEFGKFSSSISSCSECNL